MATLNDPKFEWTRKKVNQDVLKKVCENHEMNFHTILSRMSRVEHSEGRETIKGEERDVIYVKSGTSKRPHKVTQGLDGIFYCTCANWVFNCRNNMKPCKHILYVVGAGIGPPEGRMQYLV